MWSSEAEADPRDSILIRGLNDWVALDRIHWDVSQSMPGFPITAIQDATLTLIRDLVNQGLFEIGQVDEERGFSAWAEPLDEAMERVRRVYVDRFDNRSIWPWFCWLNLTEQGEQVARRIESQLSNGGGDR